jgi:hypothetical protein
MMEPIGSLQAPQMLPNCHCQGCHTFCFRVRRSAIALMRQNNLLNAKRTIPPLGACGCGTTASAILSLLQGRLARTSSTRQYTRCTAL